MFQELDAILNQYQVPRSKIVIEIIEQAIAGVDSIFQN